MNDNGEILTESEPIDPTGKQTLEIIATSDQFNEWMYQSIQPCLKGEILEIGSGLGNISKFVIESGRSITLSDYNTEYQKILSETFSGFPNVKGVLNMDLQHPDFFNFYSSFKEKYDSVFLLNVIEHLQHDETAIENCRFLLKPGGHLVLLAPAYTFLFCRFDVELGHYRRYTTGKMKTILKNLSFEIIHSRYFNFVGIAGWLCFGKLLGNKKIKSGEMSAFNKFVPLFKIADRLILKKAGLSVITCGKKN